MRGGKREGAGRKSNASKGYESRAVKIHVKDNEYEVIINNTTPRERTERILNQPKKQEG